jgi:hypothetical protein
MPSSVIDDLLKESAPKDGRGSEAWQFKADSTGRVFECRIPRDADKIGEILKRGKNLAKLTVKNSPPSWHPYLPLSESVAVNATIIAECVIEPKITQQDAVRLAKERGAYFMEITAHVKGELLGSHVRAEEEEIEALGEASGETDAASSDSSSPATSGGSTSTN